MILKSVSATSKPKKPNPKRDPKKTRSKLLKCATRVFAEHGFEGASLSDILKKAGVTKRMVYHYYGSKEGLYRAVHIHQWQVLAEWFAEELIPTEMPAQQDRPTQTLLLKAVEIFHDFSATHQDFLKLLLWDGLEGGKVSRSIWKEIRGPLYWRMEELVKAGQAQGVIPKDLIPSHFIVSFMGIVLFYFTGANTLVDIFGKDPLDKKAVAERKKQTLALFQKMFSV